MSVSNAEATQTFPYKVTSLLRFIDKYFAWTTTSFLNVIVNA